MIAAPMAPQQHPSQLTAEHRRSHHKVVEHGSAIVDRTGHTRQHSTPAHQAALLTGLRRAAGTQHGAQSRQEGCNQLHFKAAK